MIPNWSRSRLVGQGRKLLMSAPDRSHALDHIVVVLFENRSLDNVLGHLYRPGDGKNFDGVIGKDLSNPIPPWAEHGAEREVVPYTVATDMDSPNPDSGEEYFHTNTQLFNIIDDHNRFKIGDAVAAPWNAPPPEATPTMDGFVTDYISTFTSETGRQPTYDEYAHIMTGCTAEQLPVLNSIARDFGVVDPERRRDDLRSAGSARQDLEGLRHGADAGLVHGDDPLSPPEGPAGHPLRAVRRVREGRRGGNLAGLLAHRTEHAERARRLPSRVRAFVLGHRGPGHGQPVLDAGR